MTSPGAGLLRGARVLLLAAAVVGLSVVSHALAGGPHPGAVPLVVLAVLTAVAVRPLTRRQVGLPRLLGLLGAGQVALHVVFERCAVLAGTPAHGHADATSTAAMLGAHAVATIVVALVLRYGDAVLWRLWTWLAGLRVPGRPRVLGVRVAPPAVGALPTVRDLLVRGAAPGRGPPAVV